MEASLNIQKGVKVLNPYPVEAKYFNNAGTPYTGVPQVMSEIAEGLRHQGLTVNVAGVEYWWATSVLTIDPVVKKTEITLATQAEAVGGIENTKVMTALRVKEAIDNIAVAHDTTLTGNGTTASLLSVNLTKLPIRIALFKNGLGAYPQMFSYPEATVFGSITLQPNCSNYSIKIGATTYNVGSAIHANLAIPANTTITLLDLTISDTAVYFAANALLILNPS